MKQGATSNPLLVRIELAKQINRVCGTGIGPWEVDQLPDDFIDAVRAMETDLSTMRANWQKVLEAQAKVRARYNKHG